MVEQRKSSRERDFNHEATSEDAYEQKGALQDKLERAEKRHLEKHSKEEVLEEATTLAEEADKEREEQERHETSPKEKLRGAPSKKQLSKTFDAQMKGVQMEMNSGNKLFSKFIHLRAIEKTSDAVAATVTRPNAMLCGSITAFVTITLVYFLARHYGYRLSGFEMIGAFALGWVFGVLYDYISSLIRNNHRR